MDASCSVCLRNGEIKTNKMLTCGNCEVRVHQGCYGVTKFPYAGKWFCRKCESQVRKCDLCPLKSGAFKRSDSNRCGWSHVLCALSISEVTFEDNSSMDLVCIGAVPLERYNKVCVFCEHNQRNAMANYGISIPCSWLNCKSHVHATCAAQAKLLQLPSLNKCSAEFTIASAMKGNHSGDAKLKFRAFCSALHMEKYAYATKSPLQPEKAGKVDVFPSFDQPTPSKLSSSPFPFSLLGAETAKSTTLPLLDTQQADEEAEEQESNCPTPSTTAAVPTPESGSISPVDSLAASHLRPLPVAADTTEFFGNAETNTVPVSQLNGAVAKIGLKQLPEDTETAAALVSLSRLPPSVSLAEENHPSKSTETTTATKLESVEVKDMEDAEPISEQRRVTPRRSAALLANQEFTNTISPSAATTKGAATTKMTTTAATKAVKKTIAHQSQESRKRISELRPRGRPSKRARNVLIYAAKTNASSGMASRPHRVRGSRESTSEQLAISNLPQPLSPNPRQQPSAKRVRHDGSASATTPTETNPAFSSSHLKTSFNTGIRNDTTHMPPGLPRSVRGLSMPGHNGFVRQGELNSLEDLLEWQWEQGGVLLMQQAQGTDVVSLLNCLHQLKMENDLLEEKSLRLQAKLEHLRSVNSRLAISLSGVVSVDHSMLPPREAEDNVDTSINENSGGVATTTSTTSSSTMRPLQPKRMEPLPQTVRASQPPPIIINPKLPVVSLVTASPINEPTASASWVVDPPVLSRSTTFSNNPLIVESSCVSHTDRFTMGGGDKSRTPSFSSGPKVPPNASTVISPIHAQQHPSQPPQQTQQHQQQTPLVLLLTGEPYQHPNNNNGGHNQQQQTCRLPPNKSGAEVTIKSNPSSPKTAVPVVGRLSAPPLPPQQLHHQQGPSNTNTTSVTYPRIQPRQQRRSHHHSVTQQRQIGPPPTPTQVPPPAHHHPVCVTATKNNGGGRHVRAIQPAVSKTTGQQRPTSVSSSTTTLLLESHSSSPSSSLPSMSTVFGGVVQQLKAVGGESLCNVAAVEVTVTSQTPSSSTPSPAILTAGMD